MLMVPAWVRPGEPLVDSVLISAFGVLPHNQRGILLECLFIREHPRLVCSQCIEDAFGHEESLLASS